MKNKRFIDDDTINILVKRCNDYFSNKRKDIKYLEKTYNKTFGFDKEQNLRTLISYVDEILSNNNNRYIETKKQYNGTYLRTEFIYPHIEDNFKKEFNMINNLDYDKFYKDEIFPRIKGTEYIDIYFDFKLYDVDDFNVHFGRFSFDNLYPEIKSLSNKIEKALSIVNEYNEDKRPLLKKAIRLYVDNNLDKKLMVDFLSNVDFFDFEKNEKENRLKVEQERKQNEEIEHLKNEIEEQNKQQVELTELKLNGLVDNKGFNEIKKRINDKIESLNKMIVEKQQLIKK